jgi:hypothetical protein
MEEYLSFFETWSAYVLYNLDWSGSDCPQDSHVRDEFQMQWSLLRKATLFVMRNYEGQHTAERVAECRAQFEEYACRVQKVRPSTVALL